MDELMTYQSYGFSLISIRKSLIKDYRVSFHSPADVTESIRISVLPSIWVNPETAGGPCGSDSGPDRDLSLSLQPSADADAAAAGRGRRAPAARRLHCAGATEGFLPPFCLEGAPPSPFGSVPPRGKRNRHTSYVHSTSVLKNNSKPSLHELRSIIVMKSHSCKTL